jgi:hypothetical protein
MKAIYTTALFLAMGVSFNSVAQVEEVIVEEEVIEEKESASPPDTTRIRIGDKEIIIIGEDTEFEDEFEEGDEPKDNKSEAHWAGLDFGFSMLMNNNFEPSFPNYPYWENDAARSQVWNLNILEHKFNIAREYFGITTGLGFSFTSVAFRDNYLLQHSADTVFAAIDSTFQYSKNKLKASYLTVPLLLEFNTNADASKSFYLATGVVGGVRIASKLKRKGEFEGKEFTQKEKGTYGLNSFKLDATARLGYGDWGAFVNYSLLPLFESQKTTELYPLTFGLSLNF